MDKLSPIEPKKPLSYVTGALQLENNPVLDQEVPQDKIEKKTDNKDLLKSVKKIEETLVKSYELQRDIKNDVQKLAKGVKDSVGSKTNNVSAPGAKDSAKFESKGIFGDFKQGFKDQWKNMYGGKTPEAKTPNNAAPVDSVLDAAPKAETVTPDTKFDSSQAEDIAYRDKPNVRSASSMFGMSSPAAKVKPLLAIGSNKKSNSVQVKEDYNPNSDNITTNEDKVAKSSEELSKSSIEIKETNKEQLTELKSIDDKIAEQDPKKFREELKVILQKILESLVTSKVLQASSVLGIGSQSRPGGLPGPNRPPQLPGPTPTSSGGLGVEDIPYREKPSIPKTPGPVANPGPGAAGGTATRTIGSRIASAAGGIAKTAAAGAVMLGGVAIGDTIAGKMGVGKDKEGNDLKIDEAQDDKNWEKMSVGQKMVSGIGRGIEKAGDVLTFGALSNTVRKARYDRIDAETKGLATPEEQAKVKPAETVTGTQTVPSLPSSTNTSSSTPVDTTLPTTKPAEAVTEQQSTSAISPQRRQLLKSFYRLNHEFPKGTTEEEKKVVLESFNTDNTQLNTSLKNTDDALAPKVVPAETTTGKSVPAITPGGPGDTISSGNRTATESQPLGPTTDKGFTAGVTAPADKLATSSAPREPRYLPNSFRRPPTKGLLYTEGLEKPVPAGAVADVTGAVNGNIAPNSEIDPKPRARQLINIAPGDYPAAGNSPVTSVTPMGSGAPDTRLLEGSKSPTATSMGSGGPDLRLLGGRPVTSNTYNEAPNVSPASSPGGNAPDLRQLSNDNKDMEREVSNKGSSVQPIISNTISNNNTQTFVPLKPSPRSDQGSSAERYMNRVAVY